MFVGAVLAIYMDYLHIGILESAFLIIFFVGYYLFYLGNKYVIWTKQHHLTMERIRELDKKYSSWYN